MILSNTGRGMQMIVEDGDSVVYEKRIIGVGSRLAGMGSYSHLPPINNF